MKLKELFETTTQAYYAWAKDKKLDPQCRVTFKKFVRDNSLTPAMEKRLEKDANIGQAATNN